MPALQTSWQFSIRETQPTDASAVAVLHRQLLPHGFFAALGERFLGVYHRSFMANPYAVSLVACRDGRLVGMIAGSFDAQAHQRQTIRRDGVRLLSAGCVALAARPRLAASFAKTRGGRYLRGLTRAVRPRAAATPGSSTTADLSIAVLTHVAVSEEAQGCGAGSALVEAFVDRVRAYGASDRIELVTLAENGASNFYERLGWLCVGEHARDGATYRRYALQLR